eukprot:6193911-Pleurochrysis_carterae.AAC.2
MDMSCGKQAAINVSSSDEDSGMDDLLRQCFPPVGYKVPPSEQQGSLDSLAMLSASDSCSEDSVSSYQHIVPPDDNVDSHDEPVLAPGEPEATECSPCAECAAGSSSARSAPLQSWRTLGVDSKVSTSLNIIEQPVRFEVRARRPVQGSVYYRRRHCCARVLVRLNRFEEKEGTWKAEKCTSEASLAWKQLQQPFVTYSAEDNKPIFRYTVENRVTCDDYARTAYGIPKITWNGNRSLVCEPGNMQTQIDMKAWEEAAKHALVRAKSSSTQEAIDWFLMLFPLGEAIPNEFLIVHPRIIWDSLYDLYFNEVSVYGSCPPLKGNGKNAPGSWYYARAEALRRYSIKLYGVRDADPSCLPKSNMAEPKSWFRLRPRPDHFNYPECSECRARREVVERLVQLNAPRAEILAKRAEHMQHVHEMFAERDVVAELRNKAQRSAKTVFTVDDKLGSHWQFFFNAQKRALRQEQARFSLAISSNAQKRALRQEHSWEVGLLSVPPRQFVSWNRQLHEHRSADANDRQQFRLLSLMLYFVPAD